MILTSKTKNLKRCKINYFLTFQEHIKRPLITHTWTYKIKIIILIRLKTHRFHSNKSTAVATAIIITITTTTTTAIIILIKILNHHYNRRMAHRQVDCRNLAYTLKTLIIFKISTRFCNIYSIMRKISKKKSQFLANKDRIILILSLNFSLKYLKIIYLTIFLCKNSSSNNNNSKKIKWIH